MTSHLKNIGDKYDYLSKATQEEFTFRFKNEKGDFMMIFKDLRYAYVNRAVEINYGNVMLFYRTYENLELP
jgi:hypothetical protein